MLQRPRMVFIGSLNAHHTLRVPHIPATGETLTAAAFTCLGGKGANQALAAARAGGGSRQAVKSVAQDVTHLELPMGPIIFES